MTTIQYRDAEPEDFTVIVDLFVSNMNLSVFTTATDDEDAIMELTLRLDHISQRDGGVFHHQLFTEMECFHRTRIEIIGLFIEVLHSLDLFLELLRYNRVYEQRLYRNSQKHT